MELLGSVKTYDWGKLGSESEVAKLAQAADESFQLSTEIPYAELWMGDHVSGPSLIKASREDLSVVIAKNPALIGGMQRLPFLFKVLSIRKALSIQVHPNRIEAEKLHASSPDIYKDPNHKPEMAIALTPFLALCGFRPYAEIHGLLSGRPELVELIGAENVDRLKADGAEGLKVCFGRLMRSEKEALEKCIAGLLERMKSEKSELAALFLRLNGDFPGDVGCLSIFFLNLIRLKPGEAIYLSANKPHAYLEGDCIECMACSDNVVRAGLTPKFKDVETLVRLLDYRAEEPNAILYKSTKLYPDLLYTDVFVPQVEDFAVVRIELPPEVRQYNVKNSKFGSILLVVEGTGAISGEKLDRIALKRGSIVFLPATTGPELTLDVSETKFSAYQSMYNNF